MVFGAKYLGSTQLVSERNPPTSVRMAQAQEAVDRIKVRGGRETQLPPAQPLLGVGTFPKGPWGCGAGTRGVLAGAVTSPGHVVLQAPEGESQPMTEVDLFVSTQRIKVLTADTQVSREHGHPRGSGAARTFLFGPGISAGTPASGLCAGTACGHARAAGRRRVAPQPPTQACRVPRLCAAARGFSKLLLAGAAAFPDQAPENLRLKLL